MHFEFLLFKLHELYLHRLHYITFFCFCLIQISNIFNNFLTFCFSQLVTFKQFHGFFISFFSKYVHLPFSPKKNFTKSSFLMFKPNILSTLLLFFLSFSTIKEGFFTYIFDILSVNYHILQIFAILKSAGTNRIQPLW